MIFSNYFKELIDNSPLGKMDTYSKGVWPFFLAQTAVRVYYFFLLHSAVLLFFQWDTGIGPQTGISFIWPIFWLKFINFPFGLALIKISFIVSSILASFIPQSRLVRIVSFVTLMEFVALYFSVLQLDVDWFTMLLASFFLIFLPDNWSNPTEYPEKEKKKFLLVFWGTQAITLLTYSMAGIGKLVGAYGQILGGQSNAFDPKAGALHIADRLIVTNSTSPLGPWGVENYLILWPFFVGSIYLLLFSFVIAFRPSLHRLWALGLILFHTGNYLVINIGFNAHDFLLSLLLILSPFAPWKVNLKEAFMKLPLIDLFTVGKGRKVTKPAVLLIFVLFLSAFFFIILSPAVANPK
jgi:hypothetical protein